MRTLGQSHSILQKITSLVYDLQNEIDQWFFDFDKKSEYLCQRKFLTDNGQIFTTYLEHPRVSMASSDGLLQLHGHIGQILERILRVWIVLDLGGVQLGSWLFRVTR